MESDLKKKVSISNYIGLPCLYRDAIEIKKSSTGRIYKDSSPNEYENGQLKRSRKKLNLAL